MGLPDRVTPGHDDQHVTGRLRAAVVGHVEWVDFACVELFDDNGERDKRLPPDVRTATARRGEDQGCYPAAGIQNGQFGDDRNGGQRCEGDNAPPDHRQRTRLSATLI